MSLTVYCRHMFHQSSSAPSDHHHISVLLRPNGYQRNDGLLVLKRIDDDLTDFSNSHICAQQVFHTECKFHVRVSKLHVLIEQWRHVSQTPHDTAMAMRRKKQTCSTGRDQRHNSTFRLNGCNVSRWPCVQIFL